jgi:glycosyltransferase involved in cell wall biosynthesis
VLTTVCAEFPIYSQTFVHREIAQLARNGFDVRVLYSTLGPEAGLGGDCAELWNLKHRLRLHRPTHEADYASYCARFPDQVQTLVERLCDASGMSEAALTRHDNFLQAFSFSRLAEAFRPHYLHSYFFYDRSLMALVAGYLLGIPRGMTCYADHLLTDYELKVVPLHLELCDVVVATSHRIRNELIGLAPRVDPARIVVKPNAVDVRSFQARDRDEPKAGAPYRLVCTSRIDPKKGLTFLVEAVNLLRQRGRNVELHLVGGTDAGSQACVAYKAELDGLITNLGLWGTVHLEGRQNEEGVRRFLDMGHVFVAPFVEAANGDKDGIPTALLEAMASGLPVVATDAGSISEVIAGPEDGVIVPQRDPVALAGGIDALLDSHERRRVLGRRAVQLVRNRFDVRVCEGVFHDRVRAAVEARPVND